jgi:hypothetical protein
MKASRVQEIACQQVLVEDSSVFSIQWSVFSMELAGALTAENLVERYLDYIRAFTATVIRPEVAANGIRFRLLSSGVSLITFIPLVLKSDKDGSSAVMHVNGGILVQPRECDRGELLFKVENVAGGVRVSLQLSDFCPLILGGPSPSFIRRWLYRLTQAAIHRLVTVRFLALLYRSLGGKAKKIRIVRASVREGVPV